MKFRTELKLPGYPVKMRHRDRVLLIGSCFSDDIGDKLKQHKFRVCQNPYGTVFNPISIFRGLQEIVECKVYTGRDLSQYNGLYFSYNHYHKFADVRKGAVLDQVNQQIAQAHESLKHTRWLIITPGTAFVYRKKDDKKIVANCHKVPQKYFEKELLASGQIIKAAKKAIEAIREFNNEVNVIFTLSPVRHLKDGMVENNRGKAHLNTAIHQLVESIPGVYYFPSYEILMDELRDYRFYAEDLVHLSEPAIDYIFKKFIEAFLHHEDRPLLDKIEKLNNLRGHRIYHPGSAEAQKLAKHGLKLIGEVKSDAPYLGLENEETYFNNLLK